MSRLRGALSTVLNNEKIDSAYYKIAYYIAEHIYHQKKISIDDIASSCYVSKSTVSRFCRDIGYEEYYELNHDVYQLTETRFNKFERYMQDDFTGRKEMFFKDLYSGIDQAAISVMQKDIEYLADLLARYRNVAILGSLHSHSVSEFFQHDLGLFNKVVSVPMLPENQKEFVRNSDPETLILVVSCRGNYFIKMIGRNKPPKEKAGTFVLLTNNPGLQRNNLFDKVIYLPCRETYAIQPRMLSLFLNLTAVEYVYRFHHKPENIPPDRRND